MLTLSWRLLVTGLVLAGEAGLLGLIAFYSSHLATSESRTDRAVYASVAVWRFVAVLALLCLGLAPICLAVGLLF